MVSFGPLPVVAITGGQRIIRMLFWPSAPCDVSEAQGRRQTTMLREEIDWLWFGAVCSLPVLVLLLVLFLLWPVWAWAWRVLLRQARDAYRYVTGPDRDDPTP